MINMRTGSIIATALASAGTVATGVLAVKGTLSLLENKGSIQIEKKELVKAFTPAITTGAIAIAAISYLGCSNTELGNRLIKEITSHAITVAAGQKAMRALKEKAEELVGLEKTQELMDTHAEAEQLFHIKAMGPMIQPIFLDAIESGKTLCYDKFSGRYFCSSEDHIRNCVDTINQRIRKDDYVSMDDMHELLGLETTSIGWYFSTAHSDDEDVKVDVIFTSTKVSEDLWCLNVEFIGFYSPCEHCGC